MKKINVLSLFDGISCGRLALDRAGIPINTYYASEIDHYTMSISRCKFPDIIQLGDITKITKDMIKELPTIHLVIGGSPCQSLSSVNVYLKNNERGINGSGKSNLFWEYVRVLNIIKEINPNVVFLLENVGSSDKEDIDLINHTLGVNGICFNSNLLSAQYRNRLYWTNIVFKVPTQGKEISMQECLEETVEDKYYLSQKMYEYIMCTDTGKWQTGNMDINLLIARPLTATMHKMHRADTDNYVSTIYQPNGKTNVRRLTPLECERLQTLPENYTMNGLVNDKVKKISDTRRYMSVGNCWTVDVVAYIFRHLRL